MASATLKGAGVVWGLSTASSATFGAGALVQSANFGVESENVQIRNAAGDTKSWIFYDHKQTLTVEVIPSAATISSAKGENILPLPGALVTITDADDTELTGTHTGKYIFISGTKNKTNTGVVTLTFNLAQIVDTDLSTTVAS